MTAISPGSIAMNTNTKKTVGVSLKGHNCRGIPSHSIGRGVHLAAASTFDHVDGLVVFVLALPFFLGACFILSLRKRRPVRRRVLSIDGTVSIPEDMDGAKVTATICAAIETVSGVEDVYLNFCEASKPCELYQRDNRIVGIACGSPIRAGQLVNHVKLLDPSTADDGTAGIEPSP